MLKAKLLGATAAAESLAIEDVFSTYLYTGNGSTRTITNGIDLAGEGGLVWIKLRSTSTAFSFSHALFDTGRGALQYHRTDGTNASSNYNNSLTSFNSNGFSLGTDPSTGLVNYGTGTNTYTSWTFRKAERFFDVVTYTGTGANRTIAHNLGVVPGCIIVKRTDTTADWQVYHRGNTAAPETDYLVLNSTAATVDDNTRWNDTLPTSTVFSLGTATTVNASGGTYVAYLFAHDPLGPSGDGSDGLIACGSFATSGSGNTIDLGWEPQFVLWKLSDAVSDWQMFDNMRGLTVGDDAQLEPNTSDAELTGVNRLNPTATGFTTSTFAGGFNVIYIAIRRGPMREPTSGTEVFAVDAGDGSSVPAWTSGFPVDMALERSIASDDMRNAARLISGRYLVTNTTAAEVTNSARVFDYMNGWLNIARSTSNYSWMFRRAPGFFDVVAYTGTSSVRTVAHNLGVTPELLIFKRRDSTGSWRTLVFNGSSWTGLVLNDTGAASTAALPELYGDDTTFIAPTDTVFTVGASATTNVGNMIAYLFASLPGISKVGSYTGTGQSGGNINVDCGFTSGARFVMIKRTDASGSWWVADTARGIVTGNDPLLELNGTGAEITNYNMVEPYSAGFIVNGSGVGSDNSWNAAGGNYIFLAIA